MSDVVADSWRELLKEALDAGNRQTAVGLLVQGLRDRLGAEVFQEGLEQAERVLEEKGSPLFEEFCAQDEPMLGSGSLEQVLERLCNALAKNFSPERLAQLRQVQELKEQFLQKVQAMCGEAGKEAEKTGSGESCSSTGCSDLDVTLCVALLGAGVGGVLGLIKGKGALAGLGSAVIGGALGLVAGAFLEVFADEV